MNPVESRLTPFRLYLGGIGSGAVAMGLQVVLFPWLVVGILHESPDRVGIAQMAIMLPNLFLILIGGAVSDNRHLGTYLFRVYLLYAIPFAFMLLTVWNGMLNYSTLLVFGLLYGAITAFVQPARESLLPQVSQHSLQQGVARATFIQFLAQGIGVSLAGMLDYIGLAQLLIIQLAFFVVAGYLIGASQPRGRGLPGNRAASKGGILSGLAEVWRIRQLRALMSVVAATGFFGFGAYLVVMPIMTRDIYHSGPGFYAMLQLCFSVGVLLANMIFIRSMKNFSRPGKILLVSLFVRGLIMTLIALRLPVPILFPAVVLWGIFSGVSITLGRAMTHSEAPVSHRSRIVSIYQLAFFGCAPLGAFVSGLLITGVGVMQTFAALGVLTLVAAIWGGFSALWQVRSETLSVPPSPPR